MKILQFIVQNPGIYSSVQDQGRSGWAKYGVPSGGVFDQVSSRLVNWLVGNPADASTIETTGAGFEFVTEGEGTIAITGGSGDWLINEEVLEMNVSIPLSGKNHFKLRSVNHGFRSYIGINGLMDLPDWLDSKSPLKASNTFIPHSSFLRKGNDIIITSEQPFEHRRLPEELEYHFTERQVIRFIPGPEYDLFGEDLIKTFSESTYRLSPISNRMGLRLEGTALDITSISEMISSGILPGTIQINNKGLPMVLGPDAQTIGGYPRLGVVARIDFSRLSQLRPGDTISFKEVSLEDAHGLNDYREKRMDYLLGHL